MNTNHLSLLSTYTDDVLVDETGTVMSRQQGGPAFFVGEALKAAGQPFDCIHGAPITVEILITEEGEFGKVPEAPVPRPAPADRLSDWTLVSTLLDEWDITAPNLQLPDHLCVDLQGYVRNGRGFGRKRPWMRVDTIANRLFCLKGTREEVSLLPSDIIKQQKQRLLVVTDGAQDLEVYHQGRHATIPVQQVTGLTNTIGAGDTFFGHFVAGLAKGIAPTTAAEVATEAARRFLEQGHHFTIK
jgi:sugar/nucleoside kinase (ribokinase family)